jgi:hypothetical protein
MREEWGREGEMQEGWRERGGRDKEEEEIEADTSSTTSLSHGLSLGFFNDCSLSFFLNLLGFFLSFQNLFWGRGGGKGGGHGAVRKRVS